jgi:hypothetical protein
MKRLAILSALFMFVAVAAVHAEKPLGTGLGPDPVVSLGDLKATPEMWFYDQARREYQDPKMAVRAMADLRSQQRQRRIESMKWFGFSNSRPRASSDPFHNDYSPGWVATPGYYPSRWGGVSQP